MSSSKKTRISWLVILFNLLTLSVLSYTTYSLELDKESPSEVKYDRDREVTLSFTGDILTHKSLYDKAKSRESYNFDFAFNKIKRDIDSDLNFCQLETPLSTATPSSYPVFRTPIQLASALSTAGFNICSQASNHSLDGGARDVYTTRDALAKAGIESTGTTIGERAYTIMASKSIKVAYIAFTYGTNGIKQPKDHPDLINIIQVRKILALAKEAKQHADLVVIYLHWGNEYQEAVSKKQRKIAEELTSSEYIDLIVGSHIHQLQKMEIINSKPVVFGLGNFWSGQGKWSRMPKGQISAIVKLKFSFTGTTPVFKGGFAEATYVTAGDWVVRPAQRNGEKVSCFALKEVKRNFGSILSYNQPC